MIRGEHDGGHDHGSITRTQARSETPQEVLTPRQGQMMDEIDVKRVSRLGEVGLFPARTVVISLQLNAGPRTQVALPTTEQIASCKLGILFHVGHKRWRVTRYPHALSRIAVVDVALKR